MPDWHRVVREHLRLPDLRDLREQRITEEIAVQLEELYEEARARGLSDPEARRLGIDRFDWDFLADGLVRS